MRSLRISLPLLFGSLGLSSIARANEGGGIPHTISYYGIIAEKLHLGEPWVPTIGALFATALLLLIGLKFKGDVASSGDNVEPSGKFSLRFVVESLLELVAGVAKDNGGHDWRKYFPFLAALFLFILTCNLTGLIPGFPPPTESMDTNVAMGLCVLVVYNWAGLKEHGGGYIKHFLGPVAFIAPLYFCIEIVSHLSRPLSLGLRLMGNIFGDHTLLGVFTSLSYILLPALLTFFGLLVAVVQSFVFTLLTGIYISMAISHDH